MEEEDLTEAILEAMKTEDPARWKAAHRYFTAIAVCHTVVPEMKNGKIAYQAESPDEEAIVLGAKAAGYDFFAMRPQAGRTTTACESAARSGTSSQTYGSILTVILAY